MNDKKIYISDVTLRDGSHAIRHRYTVEQVAQIAASIAEFGFTNPILAGSDGIIVAGHGRLAAAQKLGLERVPVVVLDHLTPTQRRAHY